MIAPKTQPASYSAHVDMHLLLGDRRMSLCQLGPDFAILAESIFLPPTDGQIELVVDGNVSRWGVRLNEGLSVENRRFRFQPLTPTN